METRSSHVLVGGVVLLLAVALFAFILWLARFSGGEERQEFDIFFTSVSGLANGSAVNFSGVPVGVVQSINLNPAAPQTVRVRIEVSETVPVLKGTTATVEGVGFTGVSIVSLAGAMAGSEPISEPGPFGVPVIPIRPGAFASLLESAPILLENASTLLTNLNKVLNEENQAKIASLLDNLDRTTTAVADRAPELSAALTEARVTLRQAGEAAEKVGRLADSSGRLIDREGSGLAANLKRTTARADAALKRLELAAEAAEPGLRQLSTKTIPEANALIRDLRATSNSISSVAGRLDNDGAVSLLGTPPLPDYEPQEAR